MTTYEFSSEEAAAAFYERKFSNPSYDPYYDEEEY